VPGIQTGGQLLHNGEELDVSLELVDMNNTLWTPTLIEGSVESEQPGILINQKAADDLGVDVGDTITLKHPRREGLFSFRMAESEVVVAGIHANPLRSLTYMDITQADLMGLEGLTNVIHVNPAEGYSQGDVQRLMFQQSGVASVRAVSSMTKVLRSMMDLLIAFMSVVVIAVLALAFLIAFNSTSINVDERSREIATLFAFGLPIRTVTRMTMVENLITGILGTIIGFGLGYVALIWMFNTRMETMLPDVSMLIKISPFSFALAILLGVVVVALTPLLSIRKMMRMNLPSTLRVME